MSPVAEIYWSPSCFNCTMTKTFLTRHGVEFVGSNIEEPGVIEELQERGFHNIPVTFVDGVPVVGFNPARLSELLGLSGVSAVRDARTTDLLQRIERVLAAWTRTAAQVPPEEIAAPGSQLGSCVTTAMAPHLEAAMDAHASGVFEPDLPLRPQLVDRSAALELLEARERRFAAWVGVLAEGNLDRECDGHLGRVHISRALEVVLGRLAFHLARLYALLRAEGIEPIEPIDAAELAAIGSPAAMSL